MGKFFSRAIITASVIFTVMMAMSLPFAYWFAGPSEGLNISVGLLAAALLASLLQGFWFSGVVLKRTRYAVRLAGFALTCAPLIYLCGWLSGWFPRRIDATVTFFVIFLVLFVAISIGYTVYYRKTAGSYERALARYREKSGKQD